MTTSTPASAPYASSAIMRGGYSPATESGATTSRPAYVRQFGQTRCGMRGAPQFGHALCVGDAILCVERRLLVRLWDCFCFGTAIEAVGVAVPALAAPGNPVCVLPRHERRRGTSVSGHR